MKQPLAALANYENGFPFKPRDLGDNGTPVIRIRQLVDPNADLDRHEEVLPNRYVIEDGDLIFSWSGSLAVRFWDRGRAYLNQHLFRVDPADGVDRRWLGHVLVASIPRLDGMMHGSAMTHITRPMLKLVTWEVPDLDEQRRIADFLDDRVSRIDRIVAGRRDQVRALDLAAKSELADRAFDGDEFMPLRYLIQDERLGLWGSERGEDETEVRIARVADFVRLEFRVGNVPTIRSAPWTHVKPRLLRHGDVLLERSGGTQINPVGCPAYIESPDKNTVCSNFVSRLRPREEVDGRYLSLLLGALYSTRQQAPHSTQTTGIMNLDTTSYFSVRVPVRSHSEQASIGYQMEAALEDARLRQAQLNKSIDLLTEYKSSLITAAVTGELDVSTAGSSIPG